MTKILLVEKKYNSTDLEPLVTAQWIEILEGEEELFLVKQLESANKIEKLNENECVVNTQVKPVNTKISDSLIRLSTPISLLAVAIVALIKFLSQSH